jgi:hypothetical protein
MLGQLSKDEAQMDDELFQEDEAAARLHRPPATLQWWRHKGRGPKYLKIGRRI